MEVVTVEELKSLPLRYLIAFAGRLERLLPPDDPIDIALAFTTESPKSCHDGAARSRSERAIACATVRTEIGRATAAAIRAGNADALYCMAEEASDHWVSAEEDAQRRWDEYREQHAAAVESVAAAVRMSAPVIPEAHEELRREFTVLRQLPAGPYQRLGNPIAIPADSDRNILTLAPMLRSSTSDSTSCRNARRRRCGPQNRK